MRPGPLLVIFLFYVPLSQLDDDTQESSTTLSSTTTQTTTPIVVEGGPFGVEILEIYVPSGVQNAVRLEWGKEERQRDNANLTYGVFFGTEENELEFPKLTTPNLTALIEDLEYCTRYSFAVMVLTDDQEEPVKVNPNTIRSAITGSEQLAAPTNLTVELEPGIRPCLVVKWSSACPNVITPTGYVVSVLDKKAFKNNVITLPETKRSLLVYKLPVDYQDEFEIRVSTFYPGSKAAGPVSYKVPDQLQPFRVRVTVNQTEESFMIYWAQPFVPLRFGRFYYQVFVYPGQDLDAPYEKYYVTKPAMYYKGDRPENTFSVNLATYDRRHVSKVTPPLYANLNGESFVLNATFSETPER